LGKNGGCFKVCDFMFEKRISYKKYAMSRKALKKTKKQ
jgi:hypothetical protein